MPDFERLYFQLFAALADAVEAIESNDCETAREILIRAQQDAEEIYISET